jgi:hypothetical protein
LPGWVPEGTPAEWAIRRTTKGSDYGRPATAAEARTNVAAAGRLRPATAAEATSNVDSERRRDLPAGHGSRALTKKRPGAGLPGAQSARVMRERVGYCMCQRMRQPCRTLPRSSRLRSFLIVAMKYLGFRPGPHGPMPFAAGR